MRIILYTGKGGVGKTCTSAATAIQAAKRGYRTLVMSVDPAHSLGDALQIPLGDEPREILPNLHALEVNPIRDAEEMVGKLRKYMISLLVSQGLDKVIAGEVSMLPGIGELASLVRLSRYDRDNAYDVAIVDCAPTGEALRLLKFPAIMRRGISASKKWDALMASTMVTKSVSRVASMFNVTLPDEVVMQAWDTMLASFERICTLLADPDRTSVRLVMVPEQMVIRESQRAFTDLNLYGILVDAAVVNRVLPPEAGKGFYKNWYQSQQNHLSDIDTYFSPLPTLRAGLNDTQLGGLEALTRFGESMFAEQDPTARMYQGQAINLETDGENLIFSVHLPLVSDEPVAVDMHHDSIGFTIKQKRYSIALPESVAGMIPGQARLTSGRFILPFSPARKNPAIPTASTAKKPVRA